MRVKFLLVSILARISHQVSEKIDGMAFQVGAERVPGQCSKTWPGASQCQSGMPECQDFTKPDEKCGL